MAQWWTLCSGKTLQVRMWATKSFLGMCTKQELITKSFLCLLSCQTNYYINSLASYYTYVCSTLKTGSLIRSDGSTSPEHVYQCPFIIFWLCAELQWRQTESWTIATTNSWWQASGSLLPVWPPLCLRAPSTVFSKYSDNGFIHFSCGLGPAPVLKCVLDWPTTRHKGGAVSVLSVCQHEDKSD